MSLPFQFGIDLAVLINKIFNKIWRWITGKEEGKLRLRIIDKKDFNQIWILKNSIQIPLHFSLKGPDAWIDQVFVELMGKRSKDIYWSVVRENGKIFQRFPIYPIHKNFRGPEGVFNANFVLEKFKLPPKKKLKIILTIVTGSETLKVKKKLPVKFPS